MNATIVDHPLIQHKLTLMRRKETPTSLFRRLVNEIAMLLGYEVTRDLELTKREIETPLEAMKSPVLAGKKLCFVSILRAGNGLLDGMLTLMPSARVGHVGLYRDPTTLVAVEYYYKVPQDIGERLAHCCGSHAGHGQFSNCRGGSIKTGRCKQIEICLFISGPRRHRGVYTGTPGCTHFYRSH